MQGSTDTVVVLTTVASLEEAELLVRELVERRLAACGTMLPEARSVYRWEGKLAEENEVVVILKTSAEALEAMKAAFPELHPYAVPELLALPVSGGLERYLGWIGSETAAAERS